MIGDRYLFLICNSELVIAEIEICMNNGVVSIYIMKWPFTLLNSGQFVFACQIFPLLNSNITLKFIQSKCKVDYIQLCTNNIQQLRKQLSNIFKWFQPMRFLPV